MVAIKIYQKLLYQLCHNHSPTVDCLQNHMSFVGYSSGGQVASDVIIWGRILLTSNKSPNLVTLILIYIFMKNLFWKIVFADVGY